MLYYDDRILHLLPKIELNFAKSWKLYHIGTAFIEFRSYAASLVGITKSEKCQHNLKIYKEVCSLKLLSGKFGLSHSGMASR